MAFTYWLPDEQGHKQVFETESNAVIIIGANGAGKSKLGAWIERQDFEYVHRIGAQRDLNFSEYIPLKSYSQAEDEVFYGSSIQGLKTNKSQKWNHGRDETTHLMTDFNAVLAALIALANIENSRFIEEYKCFLQIGGKTPAPPVTRIDKIREIWDSIFPQRSISYSDAKFTAHIPSGGEYSSTQMSDGERAVLYLSAQVLCVPPNKAMIIDEPEIHLHRSIMNRLWKALEQCRPDCLFIYITHDTQFAAAHSHADKIWIKEYDGHNWKLEKLQDGDLPEELLLDILGSRKNVLFVEGERNSYDTQLYSELYPDYLVIPCGSCTQVIARTKAFRNNPSLHDCEVYGIIDRDFRSDYEIEKYRGDQIFTINVAEVENLFVVEELIRFMAAHMGLNPDAVFESVRSYVAEDRFANQINGQICQGTVWEIKYRLMCAEISKKNEAEARSSLDAALKGINFDVIKVDQANKFNLVQRENNYSDIIKVFNEKSIASSVGHFFGIDNKVYQSTIIALLRGAMHDEIVGALAPYLPTEIPR